MSLSPTSSVTGSVTRPASGQRATRAAMAVAVAVALLTPIAILFAQVWSSTGDSLSFAASERRGVAYLGPLTELLSVATEAQSAAVRGQPVNTPDVRSAIAAMDDIDSRLGAELRTTERWISIRETLQERTARRFPQPSTAYTQYSDLVIKLTELNRKVGDASKLILDPQLDTYYLMSATLLRIPEILVDSGRYADLSVLAAAAAGEGGPDSGALAQLTTARNRVATNAFDLADGLVRAFGETRSPTLAPGLTRPLDDFRTAVDAVAPSNSLLAPPPERSQSDLATDQDALQRTALALQEAALTELDLLLTDRETGTGRTRLLAAVAAGLGVLLAVAVAVVLRPAWQKPARSGPQDAASAHGGTEGGRHGGRTGQGGPGGPTGPDRPARPGPAYGPAGAGRPSGLVDVIGAEHRGGSRAPR